MTKPSAPSARVLSVVVVTGLSGAGKSTALNALEDLGYYCVDNLPPPVFHATLEALRAASYERVAVCMDVRGRAYLEGMTALLREAAEHDDYSVELLYLDAAEELLARRFSATRRPHPLSRVESSGVRAVMDGLRLESSLLAPLRGMASVVLDTGALTVHDLRRQVLRMFSGEGEKKKRMFVRVVSFGFKYGAPHDCDIMLDVRFLPNPYFVPELKAHSGKDADVAEYVMACDDTSGFLERTLELLAYCVPRFENEGKSYVSICIGCTGGRHRSVALTERIARELADRLGISVDTVHRDIRQAEHLADTKEVASSPNNSAS